MASKNETANQLSSIAEARLSLDRRLRNFRSMQKTMMPFVSVSDPQNGAPENLDLHLPSSFKRTCRPVLPSMVSLDHLQHVEAELRFAHAQEALDSLRRNLLVQVHYSKYTRANVRGQGGNTRMQSLLQQTTAKTQAIAARYSRIRQAYHSLKGEGSWERELRPLTAQDIRPLSDTHIARDKSSMTGEGHKSVSWIWRSSLSGLDSSGELNEGKSYAVTWQDILPSYI